MLFCQEYRNAISSLAFSVSLSHFLPPSFCFYSHSVSLPPLSLSLPPALCFNSSSVSLSPLVLPTFTSGVLFSSPLSPSLPNLAVSAFLVGKPGPIAAFFNSQKPLSDFPGLNMSNSLYFKSLDLSMKSNARRGS